MKINWLHTNWLPEKKVKEKCEVCNKKIATWECICGMKLCNQCHTEYGGDCPNDEQQEHFVEKIKK